MEKQVLRDLVSQGLSSRGIAHQLQVSQSTIKYWLAKYGLTTQFRQFGTKPHLCKHCGETTADNFYGDRKECCKKCFLKTDNEIGVAKKLQAVEYMGGKCSSCGYNRYYGALEFHHIDRSKKEKWGSIRNWGWDRIIIELKKCILLCANCHREIHGES